MKPLLIIASMFFSCNVQAQQKQSTSTPGQTSFYAEVGGPGILFSANIDRRFTKSALGWGGRIGLGFISGYDIVTKKPIPYDPNNPYNYNYNRSSVMTVPVQVNYIFGKPSSTSSLEIGAGFTYLGKKLNIFDYNDNTGTSLIGTASFMYRRLPKEGGFSWRLGFTPIIAKGYIQPSAAASIGYNF